MRTSRVILKKSNNFDFFEKEYVFHKLKIMDFDKNVDGSNTYCNILKPFQMSEKKQLIKYSVNLRRK